MYAQPYLPFRALIAALFTTMMLALAAFAQADTIDATVRGTSTQLGRQVSIKIVIDHF